MEEKKIVLIIGAGPSGIASAKYAVDHGFIPYVLQKESEVGGVWNPQSGLTWNSMKTNLSRYSCSFKDFPWEETADMFPPTKVMHNYFVRYAKHFDLYKFIHFNCQVTFIDYEKSQDGIEFSVEWQNSQKKKQQMKVEKLIVANGMFHIPFIPKILGLENFKGKVIHSHSYKEGKDFEGQRVLTVGGSFTGVELSADISHHTAMTIHTFKKPFFLFRHFVKFNQEEALPLDIEQLKWFNVYAVHVDKNPQALRMKNQFLMKYCKGQQDIQDLKITEADMNRQLYFAISTTYEDQVRKGKMKLKRGNIKELKENSVVFDDGTEQQIDTIILATGYKTELKFLSPKIKEVIEYDINQQRQPTILFQQMIHPDIPNLVFVGLNKNVNIQGCQIQARFATAYLAGKVTLPSQQQIQKQMQYERDFRTLPDFPQWPHDNYVKFGYELAQMIDPSFDFQKLKKQNPKLYKQMIGLPVIQHPNNWTFNNLEKQIEHLKRIIEVATVKVK